MASICAGVKANLAACPSFDNTQEVVCRTTKDILKQNLMPSPPVKSNAKIQPIRTSCKECSDAKVKCEKGNPACTRCQRRGHQCVYQRSRRIGRRPHKPRSPTPGTSMTQVFSSEPTPRMDCDEALDQNLPAMVSTHTGQAAPWDSSNFNTDEYSYPVYNTDYMTFDFTGLRVLPSPAPFTPPLTASSSSLAESQTCSPSQIQTPLSLSPPSLPTDPTGNTLSQASNQFPSTGRCDCISRLIAISTQPKTEMPLVAATRSCPPVGQNVFDVCNSVLMCGCISDDERAISLLSFVILHALLQFGETEWSKSPEAFGEAEMMRNPLALVKGLATRLHACQPGFARAKNPFILYWLATMGS